MGVRDRQKQPDIALVVVIDQSGSMAACHCNSFNGGMGGGSGIGGVQKVDIGKEAILRAAAALTERDELGVVGFNEAAHWVVHTQPLGGIADLQGQIAGIRADGQTNIYAGLDQAVQSLERRDRHAPPHHPADRRLVHLRPVRRDHRQDEGGRHHALDGRRGRRRQPVPRAARQAGRRPLLRGDQPVEHPRHLPQGDPAGLRPADRRGDRSSRSRPRPRRSCAASTGLPQLRGYNGTTIKPAAQSVLVTARDDPLLAQWQYGLGRSVAWTSDSTGRWAKDWVGWSGFNRFFSQLCQLDVPGRGDRRHRGDLPDDRRQDRPPRRERRDRTARRATSTRRPRASSGRTSSHGPSTSSRSRPGSTRRRSARSIRVRTRSGSRRPGRGRRHSGGRSGWSPRPPAEYRQLGANEPFLASLRAATGGTVVATALDPWRHDLTATDRFTELWPLLLVLALLLWPLDIALRRMSLGRRELVAARGWVRGIGRRRSGAGPRTATAEAMLAASGRVAERRGACRDAGRAGPESGGAGGGGGGPDPDGQPDVPAPKAARPATAPHGAPGASRAPPPAPAPRRARPARPSRPTRWPGCATRSAGHATAEPRPGASGRPVVASGSMSLPRSLGLGLVVLLVAGCSYVETTPPPPTPADFRGSPASSSSAASSSTASSRATPAATTRSSARPPSRSTRRGSTRRPRSGSTCTSSGNRATFERLRATIDACARTYVTDPQTYESVEQSPFVMAGQGPWGRAVRGGPAQGAGGGGRTGD